LKRPGCHQESLEKHFHCRDEGAFSLPFNVKAESFTLEGESSPSEDEDSSKKLEGSRKKPQRSCSEHECWRKFLEPSSFFLERSCSEPEGFVLKLEWLTKIVGSPTKIVGRWTKIVGSCGFEHESRSSEEERSTCEVRPNSAQPVTYQYLNNLSCVKIGTCCSNRLRYIISET
jgi:hypothetical protein